MHKSCLVCKAVSKQYSISLGSFRNCSGQLSANKAIAGTTITVLVQPKAGYGSASISTSPSVSINKINDTEFQFVMPESDIAVSGTCTANTYRVYADIGSGASLTSCPSSAATGSRVEISWSLQTGYGPSQCTRSDGGSISKYAYSCVFTMPPNDVTVTARFTYYNECKVSISNDTDWSGTVRVTGNAGFNRSFSVSAFGNASATAPSSNTSMSARCSGGSWDPDVSVSKNYRSDGYCIYSVYIDYNGG